MRADVWLIAPEWRLRTLVRAELLEAGWSVLALEGWDALREMLTDTVAAPGVLIVQLTGDEPAGVLAELAALPVPRLVLRATGAPDASALRRRGIDAVLSRPFRVADVVQAARRLLQR